VGHRGMGDRKQSAKNRYSGGSGIWCRTAGLTTKILERGRRHTPLSSAPDNSRVIRLSSASAIFVAEMTIITGFALILVLAFLGLALTLPSELWQESPNAKKSKPTAAAPPS
jgi:hypothetical protein